MHQRMGLFPRSLSSSAFHFRALLSAIEKAAAMFCSFIVQPLSRYICVRLVPLRTSFSPCYTITISTSK